MVAEPLGRDDGGTSHRETLIKIAVIGGLLVALNFWHLYLLPRALSNPNWSHGYIIPLFSLFLIWSRRDELAAARKRACIWAVPMILLALLGQVIGFYALNRHYWFCRMCMVAMLFFLVLYLTGPDVIRVLWLPILYLALAIPLSRTAYEGLSVPLQNIAAKGSAGILAVFNIDIKVVASGLTIVSDEGYKHKVVVAEQCSGMRSLLAYVALGVAWAYLENRPVWQRIVLVASIIPVAIFCNVVRVAITCLAYYYDQPQLGEKFMHTATGMLMLVPALALFILLGWILKRLFVDEEQPSHDGPGGQQQGTAAREGGA